MKDMINEKVKRRESFRPFAPVVRRERLSDYFDLNVDSPYMLLVAPIKKELQYPLPEGLSGLSLLNAPRSTLSFRH